MIKLPKRKQEGNLSVIEILKGSRVNIDLTSNRILESANILVDEESIKFTSQTIFSLKALNENGSKTYNPENVYCKKPYSKGSQLKQEIAVIGAGAVVLENTVIPPFSLVVGTPGKVIRQTPEDTIEKQEKWAQKYVQLAKIHKKKFGMGEVLKY